MTQRRKIIEVSLTMEDINRESYREMPVRHVDENSRTQGATRARAEGS